METDDTVFFGITKIRVCPNGCRSNFDSNAHVVQAWEVDIFGKFERVIEDCTEVTHDPYEQNYWSCLKCGAQAIMVNVKWYQVTKIDASGHKKTFDVFIPINDNSKAYCRKAYNGPVVLCEKKTNSAGVEYYKTPWCRIVI